MKYNPQRPPRKSLRLKGFDYTQPGGYFITMVAIHRECLFGKIINGEMILSDTGRIAQECWQAIPEHFDSVHLGAFVIMPNHVHGILILGSRCGTSGDTIYRVATRAKE